MIVLAKDEAAKSDVDSAGFVAGALGNNWMNEVDKLLESMSSSATSTEEGTLPDLELGWDLDPIGTSASMVGTARSRNKSPSPSLYSQVFDFLLYSGFLGLDYSSSYIYCLPSPRPNLSSLDYLSHTTNFLFAYNISTTGNPSLFCYIVIGLMGWRWKKLREEGRKDLMQPYCPQR